MLHYDRSEDYQLIDADNCTGSYRLWIRVIKVMLLDYSFYKRRSFYRRLKYIERKTLKELTLAIFTHNGALMDILSALSGEPEALWCKLKDSITDEKIRSNQVLDLQMRRNHKYE